jgi:hypothetical protein
MTNKRSWTLEVQEDPETGDAILEFPPELIETTGWQEGDTLTWTDLGNGSWSLTKQQPDVTIEEEEAWRDLENKINKA